MSDVGRLHAMHCWLVAILAAASLVHDASAQNMDSIRVDVSRIQARGIYVDHAGSASWQTDDTLFVRVDGGPGSRARIVGRTSTTLLLAWIDGVLDLSVGDTVLLVGPRRQSAQPTIEATPEEKRESILNRPGRARAANASNVPHIRVRGRAMISASALQSKAKGRMTENVEVTRRFLTPVSSVRLQVVNLPGRTQMNLHARLSRRFSSNDIIGQSSSARFYDLSVSQPIGGTGAEYAVGRFNVGSLIQSGYWDGARLEYRSRSLSWGVIAGFEPDRFNQGFQSELPKYAVYAGTTQRFDRGLLALTGAFTEMRPSNERLTHSFFSLDQRLQVGSFRLNNRILLDRDPESRSWISSRYQSRLQVPVSSSVQLFTRYSMRQPYAYWRTADVISARRDQVSVGVSLVGSNHRLTVTGIENRIDGRDPSYSGSTYFSSEPSWSPIRMSGSFASWWRTSSRTLYGMLGAYRDVGRSNVGLQLTTYNVDTVGPAVTSFMVGLSARIPVHQRGALSIRTRSQFSGDVTSNQLYLSYWIAF